LYGSTPKTEDARIRYIKSLQQKMDSIHKLVRHCIEISSNRMKDHYDTKAGGFTEGDKVGYITV